MQKHYHLLPKMSMDSVFNANLKEEVEDSVSGYIMQFVRGSCGSPFKYREKRVKL